MAGINRATFTIIIEASKQSSRLPVFSSSSSSFSSSLATYFTSFRAYTIPVQVGATQQNLSLQVDTGSSDLWIASTACSTASCSSTNGRLYDPSSSQPTGATFNIQYLAGSVSGPIVWDQIQIGGYTISNQALAAATSVNSEPLSYDFDGILGLSLPLNSLIRQAVPATTNNNPDGAPFSSNLLALTPSSDAPSQAFFSLTLARPGSNQIPSLLGIGQHPSDIVPDPTKIQYSPLVSESVGILFWKTSIKAITVYVGSQARPVSLQSVTGAAYPTALLDSGVPLIITTSTIANGIYGALGISPASDGQYYVPCDTPLNMTITLDGQPELPIHPLDLTNEPSGQSDSQYCIGLIQSDDSQLTPTSDIGDMILGVPFMRNVYTVMAYEQPDANGVFDTSVHTGTHPTLGLLGLTNITQALDEFHTVRVLNQPLSGGQSQQSTSSSASEPKLSVGVVVLVALVGFFALCVLLFGLRCFLARRQWRKRSAVAPREGEADARTGSGSYQLTRRHSRASVDEADGNALRALTFSSSLRKEQISQYTVDTSQTRVEDPASDIGLRKYKNGSAPDLGDSDPWNPYSGEWRDTIVGTDAGDPPHSPLIHPPPDLGNVHSNHQHTASELISVPLLSHRHSDSENSDVAEYSQMPAVLTMAGIGTAARGSVIDFDRRHSRARSDSSGENARSMSPFRSVVSNRRSSRERPPDTHSHSLDTALLIGRGRTPS
ncbi:aspartic peptidase domain-containing protein [Phlebopus sp. FC_14]|nr:aspartic peptidase domain-containing protein [Phlebopus sp. FC_14]